MIALAAIQLREGDSVMRLADDGERYAKKIKALTRVDGQIKASYEDGLFDRFGLTDRVRIAERI